MKRQHTPMLAGASSLLLLLAITAGATIPMQDMAAYAEIQFMFKFGTYGDQNKQLNAPTDITLDKNGRSLYIVDSGNNRINVFDSDDGDNEFRFGTFCALESSMRGCNDDADGASRNGDGQFSEPLGITADKRNNFYVLDSGNNRIQIFDDDGMFKSKFGSSERRDDTYLGSPMGIAVHGTTGNILVSDAATDTISIFESDGDFILNFKPPSDNGKLRNPSGMAIDNSQNILFVADTGNDRIVMFELTRAASCKEGTTSINKNVCFAGEFGTKGSKNGEFDSPMGLAVDPSSSTLYVSDTDNDRIQVFKITDKDNTCKEGTKKMVDGVCFVDKFGSKGSKNGEFDSPSGMALDTTNNLLFVADTDNDRIQVFNQTSLSEPSSSSSSSTQVPDPPDRPKATPVSPTSIAIVWNQPDTNDRTPAITGYKVQFREGSSGAYTTIAGDTASTSTMLIHKNLEPGKKYSYRVYSINPEGTSASPSTASRPVAPAHTDTPTALLAVATSPSEIKLSWMPPSNTYDLRLNGYTIEREITTDVYDTIGRTDRADATTYTVTGLATGKTYTYAIRADIGQGTTDISNTASATPTKNSTDNTAPLRQYTLVIPTAATAPIKLGAQGSSATQIDLSWRPPADDGNSPITGYKIESKRDSGQFNILVEDTNSDATKYTHTGLSTHSKYTYRVYAINAEGTSLASNEISSTPKITQIKISPINKRIQADEGKQISFTAKLTADSLKDGVAFALQKPPTGARITSSTGVFTWTPSDGDGPRVHTFDVVAKKGSMSDRQTVTINVADSIKVSQPPEPEPEPPAPELEPEPLGTAPFVDASEDPQSYVDRYNTEDAYKQWFDSNYPQYDSIYQAVGLEEPLTVPAPFVDASEDPQSYVDRYNTEDTYKQWFDSNYPQYDSIYQAVGLDTPNTQKPPVQQNDTAKDPDNAEVKKFGICGTGTKLIDGVCTIMETSKAKPWWQFW